MRAVLDTNVWLSGLLWGGLPSQLVQQVECGELQAIASEAILDELVRTLARPKLQRRLSQLRLDAASIMLVVRQAVVIVPDAAIAVENLRDPKDAMIVAAAIVGRATVIITGDQDLLVLEAVAGIKILTPRDFLLDSGAF
jgi:uncharacterized protein